MINNDFMTGFYYAKLLNIVKEFKINCKSYLYYKSESEKEFVRTEMKKLFGE